MSTTHRFNFIGWACMQGRVLMCGELDIHFWPTS